MRKVGGFIGTVCMKCMQLVLATSMACTVRRTDRVEDSPASDPLTWGFVGDKHDNSPNHSEKAELLPFYWPGWTATPVLVDCMIYAADTPGSFECIYIHAVTVTHAFNTCKYVMQTCNAIPIYHDVIITQWAIIKRIYIMSCTWKWQYRWWSCAVCCMWHMQHC